VVNGKSLFLLKRNLGLSPLTESSAVIRTGPFTKYRLALNKRYDNEMQIEYDRDSSVFIVTSCGIDGQFSIPGRERALPLLHRAQTDSGTHQVCFLVGTCGYFSGGEEAEA
jgi:hypothetical protein